MKFAGFFAMFQSTYSSSSSVSADVVRLKRLVIAAPFALALWMPEQCWAQGNNIEFVRPPAVAPSKAVDDSLHPPPKPESPVVSPAVRQPLPVQVPLESDSYTDGAKPLSKETRTMEELQLEMALSLGMPSEPASVIAGPRSASAALNGLQSAAPITTDWSQIGSGIWNRDLVHFYNGRIRQASYAYDNAQGFTTLWLGATGGGLWKALISAFVPVFVPVSDTLPGSPSVGAFLVQPGNSNNILIGTGDFGRNLPGTGMYKTTDGGTTWHPVSPSDGTGWPNTFQKILIDVSDASNQTVIAQGDPGIWRSTDFGDSWAQVYSGQATDLVQVTAHPWIWYAGAPGIGVLRSTTSGQSFAPIGTGITAPVWRVTVAWSKSAPWRVYAMTAGGDNGGYLTGIWRSDNYGDGNWINIRAGEGPNTPAPRFSGIAQAFHTSSLAVDPDNADLVFAGMAGMLVTANGTASAPTWEHCETPGSRCTDDGHSDHTGFVFEPGTNNVLGTGDGGVFVFDKSTLKLAGNLNYGNNLNVQQVFADGDEACSRIRPDFCTSGLQDNGVVSIDRMSDPTMTELNGGDGGSVSIAPDTDWLFGMSDGGRYYSTDGGANWTGDYGACISNGDFYATTMVDQTPNRPLPYLYTVVGGAIWFKPVDPTCNWHEANSKLMPFSPVHVDAANDPNGFVFYVTGWSSGKLYVADSYTDGPLGSMTPEDRTPPLPAGSSLDSAGIIAADRSILRPSTVTYTTDGARPARAYISNDRALHWKDVTGDLPVGNYIKLIANPIDQQQMFLSTDMGIYRTDNGGVNWYRYMNGLPAVVHAMGMELNADTANPPLLHIGTFGRGFWDRQVAPDVVLQSVTVNPTSIIGGKPVDLVVTLDRAATSDVTVSLSSSDPSVFPVPASVTITAGYHNAGIVVPTSAVTVEGGYSVTVTATYNEVRTATAVLLPRITSYTSLVSSLNPSAFGQNVTFTATASSRQGTPDGYVTFQDAGQTITIASLTAGKATLDDPYLSVGVHSITAVYEGSTTYYGSTSPARSQTVTKASTSVSLVSSANLHPVPFGLSLGFTATVKSSTLRIPGGTIKLMDGKTVLATKVVNLATGTALFFGISTLSVGSHAMTAVYTGNGTYQASISPVLTLQIIKAMTTTAVTSNVNPSSIGQSVTFTAHVTPSTSGTPTGTVTFNNGALTLGSAALSGGKATLTTATLAVGMHGITAVYSGSSNFVAGTSAMLLQTVTLPTSATALSSSLNPSTFGAAVTFTATVTSTGGTPSGTVTFKNGGHHAGSRRAQQRQGNVHHRNTGGGCASDHGGLLGKQRLPHQHFRNAATNCQAGDQCHRAHLFPEPIDVRQCSHLHCHRHFDRRHSDGTSDLQERFRHDCLRHA